MPEGPEVKIASDYFNNFFSNSKSVRFEMTSDYYTQKYSKIFHLLNNNLENYTSTFTIGKNIFIGLKNKLIFNLHLGMTGGWLNNFEKHCHFRVFTKNKELFYKDVRKFGKVRIINLQELEQKNQSEFDLLNNKYDLTQHISFLNSKIKTKKSLCSILMNQSYFPGVGNYIKSETLFESKLHPEEKWINLDEKTKIKLIKNTKKIMDLSYKSGGAELKDFKNPFKKSNFILKIYGKKNTHDNYPIKSLITSDNRKSWICEKLQKLKK
ncbi:MAG: hypothetical protein CMP65_05530 [Flavobacteriales bacterium]|nr:hypothetical protein [Flavobacteriales bacterium]|tara:strand:+ start:2361 stop:3161 length:801 start_codon:yes stop_codon:yes gene_type:complete